MKSYYSIVLACSLAACADRWDGGGRRHELPADERMQELPPSSGEPADGGAGLAGSPPDESAGTSVGGTGGVGGLGFVQTPGAFAGLGSGGSAGSAGSGGTAGVP
jgi:hypothetical protein